MEVVRSRIGDRAENRMHAPKALLVSLLGIQRNYFHSEELKAYSL